MKPLKTAKTRLMPKTMNIRPADGRMKIWETALCLAVSVTLLTGVLAQGAQRSLAADVLRLHVVGASDSEFDQTRKLEVRDAVLKQLEPALEGAEDAAEVERIAARMLPELKETAERVGGTEAEVFLGEKYFPTRDYGSFSLPAGRYRSLCITLGEGVGRNWWCVVFPPLCMEAAAGPEAAPAGLTDSQWEILREDPESEGYCLRFRVLEFWGMLSEKF